ncbi:MAG TPA: serine hydrolase domain-containing protein [Gemmatimonadaceae bacterium]|nr:serine hydrolase domain-containing protein [Gemmatimonadaceae bacterium]
MKTLTAFAATIGVFATAFVAKQQTVPPGPRDRAELNAFLDSAVNAMMKRDRIPGAAVCFVRNGELFTCRGYGVSDIARKTPVSPDSTIWRIGSISKVFTAFGVVQLADQGRVDLNADVNRYLTSVKVKDTLGGPVLVEHLLDHTAGFDEIRPGTMAPNAAAVLPLGEFLRTRLVRVRSSGTTTSYSTYGMTLAGAMIEDVTKQSHERFLDSAVWAPLGMKSTNVNVPASQAHRVAIGYSVRGDSVLPEPWEWYLTTPASSVNSTARDMSTFIIANLQLGRVGNARVLSQYASRFMQRQHATPHPRLPGFALGFYEDYVGALRTVEHAGDMAGFSALMVLIPEHNDGFFIVQHREGGSMRDELKERILNRYYPASLVRLPVPAPPPDFRTRVGDFVGRFVPSTSCHTCTPRSAPYIVSITAAPDSSALMMSIARGRRFIEVAPLLFVREDGSGYVAFRRGPSGTVTEMFVGNIWNFERVQ